LLHSAEVLFFPPKFFSRPHYTPQSESVRLSPEGPPPSLSLYQDLAIRPDAAQSLPKEAEKRRLAPQEAKSHKPKEKMLFWCPTDGLQ
jgi:hypothetical protein